MNVETLGALLLYRQNVRVREEASFRHHDDDTTTPTSGTGK